MRRRRFKGLTLAEVIVACGVLMVLGTALIMCYNVCLPVYRQGGGRIDVQQHCRETVRRIVPLLNSAISPDGVQEALFAPAPVGAVDTKIEFATTLDALGASAMGSVDPRNPTFYRYRIRFDGTASQIVLEDVDQPSRSRVLAREVQNVAFYRVALDAVKIHVESMILIRGARNQQRTVSHVLETVQQVPYYTCR